jgi:dephospho-CoA kinase
MASPPSTESRPFLVGLTGGIASGKSAVSAAFARLGVPVLDADVVAREVVAPGQPALAAVVASFGSGVLAADGTLDRSALRARIFSNPAERHRLEAILHPAIRQAFVATSAALGGVYQVHAIPLLVENARQSAYDRVLVVDCPESLQRQRLSARDNETPERITAMMAAQATRSARLAVATEVLDNTHSLAELETAVAALHEGYLQAARKKP